MPLGTLLAATVIPYVTSQIFDAYEDKYIKTKLKQLLFPKKDYLAQLNIVINRTIKNYDLKYSPEGKFPFYHHQETFAQLTTFILFEDEQKSVIESLDYSKIDNIDKPTHEQIGHFYNYFIQQIQEDNTLKDLYFEENYKAKIFDISKDLSIVKNIIEDFINKIPDSSKIIKSWIEKIYSNLKSLKSSTALEEINHFEKDILPSYNVSDKDKAFVYFVKGLCLNENGKAEEAVAYFEQAYTLDKDNTSYYSWHLYLQYLFVFTNDLLDKIRDAIKLNPFDPLLNGIVTMESLKKNQTYSSVDIPIPVQNNWQYKRIIYRFYLKNNFLNSALEYFKTDKLDIAKQLKDVSIDNYGYIDFYLELYFIQLLKKFPNNTFFKLNQSLKDSEELKTCINYFEEFKTQIIDCEKEYLKNLFSYLLNILFFFRDEKKTHLDEAYSIYNKNKKIISPFYYSLLKFGYSQVGDYKSAIEIIGDDESIPEQYYFKSVLYNRLRDDDNRKKLLLKFINSVQKVDAQNINMLLDGILFSDFEMQELESFYKKLLDNIIETNGIIKDVLIATKGVFLDSSKDASLRMLENNFKIIYDESFNNEELIIAYCRLLHAYKDWIAIITILNSKKFESFETHWLLIDALWYSKKNPTKLLSILKILRESKSPQSALYFEWELNLNYLLGDWDQIFEIATTGKYLFPKSDLFSYYLALYYLNDNNKDEYLRVLTEVDIFKYEFSNFQFLNSGLITLGEYSSAIEQAYYYTTKNDSADARMYFFNVFIFNADKFNYKIPVSCEEGYFIKIRTEAGNTIDVNFVDNNNIFTKLLGKKVGEKFNLSDVMTSKIIEYEIIGIRHKYEVLIDQINKEAENPELTGIPMKSFHFEGGDVRDWNKQLVELFGKSSDDRNVFIENELDKYKRGELSFLQLTHSVFDDDIFDSYITVSDSSKLRLSALSRRFFSEDRLKEYSEKYCIDLPTIILFSGLNKSSNINFEKCFIISKHTHDYIVNLLDYLETKPQSKLTLNITSEGVTPYPNQEDYYKGKIELLKSCIDWVNLYCEILTSSGKLDFMINFQDKELDMNSLVLSYVDTLSLTHEKNAIMISDEKTAFGILHKSKQIIGVESYLETHIQGLNNESLYELLSSKNYIGIEVPRSKAEEIAKFLISSESEDQEYILQVFSIINSGNSANVIALLDVMVFILNGDITMDKKQSIINLLFVKLFEGIYSNRIIMEGVINLLKLGLSRLVYSDNIKYKIIFSEMDSVLKKNNISI